MGNTNAGRRPVTCKGGGGRKTVGSLSSLAALALLALTACAPNLGDKPEMQPPGSYATAKSFAAPAAEWPQETWWKAYDDPQLDGLIDEALKAQGLAVRTDRLECAIFRFDASPVLAQKKKESGYQPNSLFYWCARRDSNS